MKLDTEYIEKLKDAVFRIGKVYTELNSLEKYMQGAEQSEKRIIASQIALVRNSLKSINNEIPPLVEKINTIDAFEIKHSLNIKEKEDETLLRDIPVIKEKFPSLKRETMDFDDSTPEKGYTLKELRPTSLEKLTLKRMRKQNQEKLVVVKEKEASGYVQMANKFFAKTAEKIVSEKTFYELERDLIKANLQFTPRSYISVIFLTTCIAFIAGLVLAVFFLFFKITPELPIIISATGDIGMRLLRSLLIFLGAPIITFLIMYSYPGTEKSSTEYRIEEELPFATIHMSAISGSMIDPSKIFEIIITTHEYPYLEKEFKKLINQINLYGYDLVSALRTGAYNNPSKRLSELFVGLATTINSGGYLPEFFDKRSQTLLFDNRLMQEKKTKAAETFMDIYISLVVAAPMILMILLMMMKISGLGIAMSTSMITVVMVAAVSGINVVFLTFLQLKK